MSSVDPDTVRRQQCFDRVYDAINKAKLSNDENYDRAILTIASSALGVSVHFVLSSGGGHLRWSLYLGWALLGLAVSLILAAYKVSNWSQDRNLESITDYYLRNNQEAITAPNPWESTHQNCTLWAGVLMLFGMVLLAVYFVSNIPSQKEASQVADEHKRSADRAIQSDRSIIGDDGKVTAAASAPAIIQVPSNENRAASTPAAIPVVPKADTAGNAQSDSSRPTPPAPVDVKPPIKE